MRHPLFSLRLSRCLASASLPIALGCVTLVCVPACQSSKTKEKEFVDSGPMYTGPRIFEGTIGSLARLGNDEPMLVSGYGLLTGLPGTGSPEVLPYLSAYMQDQIKRGGLDPAAVLADGNAAVVVVQGLIPPGAFAGDRFDLWVEGTVDSIASVAGGRLYTTDMQPGAPARDMGKYLGYAAKGGGAVYTDPFDKAGWEKIRTTTLSYEQFRRQGIILGGGTVSQDRPVFLTLNQPSYTVANQIVDALNVRFPPVPGDRAKVAVAHDNQRITLRVPLAFRADPAAFIEQVRWLYVQRVDPSFAPDQTRRMLAALAEEEKSRREAFAEQCVTAWKAMGAGALSSLRPAYALESGSQAERELWPELGQGAGKDPKRAASLAKAREAYPVVRDAAVRAGAALGDADAIALLAQEARGAKDAQVRIRCIASLADQPNNRMALGTLRDLLADSDTQVRIAAYDAYCRAFSALSGAVGEAEAEKWMGGFHRTFAYGSEQETKYAVDVVPVGQPLVLLSVSGQPRVTIFGDDEGLRKPLSLWFDDSAVKRISTDAAARAAAVKQLAKEAGITEAAAQAQLDELDKRVTASSIPLGGRGRLNLRVADELVSEDMRAVLARQIKAERGIPFVEACKLVPASREVLAFSFYPGNGAKQEFKAVNSMATLAFALGHREGARYAQKGLDFDFDRVTRILHELSLRHALGAPVLIRVSPLADRMRKAAQSTKKPDAVRPEGVAEDLAEVLGAGAAAKPPAAKPTQPASKAGDKDGKLPSWQ